MASNIIILAILVILSAFFSGSEIALIALSPAQVRALSNNKKRGSASVTKLKKNPARLLITILIGNNVVNITASAYAAVFFTNIFGSSGIGIATGIMTFFILVFGEIVPKAYANDRASKIALIVGPVIYYLQLLLYPIIWLLEHLTRLFAHKYNKKLVTEDELKAMVRLGVESGEFEAAEEELIENVLQFNDIHVIDIMTPRIDVDALDADTSIRDCAQFIIEHAHTRIPVYKDTIDNVIGLISVKDILAYIHESKDLDKKISDLPLLTPIKTPCTKRINRLFNEFKKARIHMAIVYDEHGGFAGIITLEDILEEIVGEIIDEHDEEEEDVQKVHANAILVKGGTHVDIIMHALRFSELPSGWIKNKPISAVILEKLKRFPRPGEVVVFGDIQVKIEKMTHHRILMVGVTKNSK